VTEVTSRRAACVEVGRIGVAPGPELRRSLCPRSEVNRHKSIAHVKLIQL
jgi:hypothetical protein